MCHFSKPFLTENYSFEVDIQFFHFNVLLVSNIFEQEGVIENNSNGFRALKAMFL
jgi:hypothetical protein